MWPRGAGAIPPPLGHELLVKLKLKKRNGEWKQRQATQEEIQTLSEHAVIKLGNAQMQLNLTRNVKDHKKDFYKYIGDKGNRKSVGLLLSERGP